MSLELDACRESIDEPAARAVPALVCEDISVPADPEGHGVWRSTGLGTATYFVYLMYLRAFQLVAQRLLCLTRHGR